MTEEEAAKLTREEKIALYNAGLYRFQVPPVYTGNWDIEAWLKWIGNNWLVEISEEEYRKRLEDLYPWSKQEGN